MSKKGFARPRQGSSVQRDCANRPRGALILKRNEAASAPPLDRHCRDNRNTEPGAHHTQNAAELTALKNDIGLQPGPAARRHRRFAEAMAIAQKEKRLISQLAKRNRAAPCERMLLGEHRIQLFRRLSERF